MEFINNGLFAWRLIQYMIANGYISKEYTNVLDWLKLCSGVEKVEVFTGKYDEGVLYCGIIYDFENNRSEMLSLLSTQLVQFHFAWGAFESLIPALVPKEKIFEYGKINATCGFLKKAGLNKFLPNGYLNQYNKLLNDLRNAYQYNDELEELDILQENKYSYRNYVDKSGIGAFVVYKIRNKFAHGSMVFPYPEDYTDDKVPSDVGLIETATRLILNTIQILLINDIKDGDYIFDDDCLIENAIGNSALEYLSNLHINNIVLHE